MDEPKRKAPRIALLGWGSLIWDTRPEFDEHRGEWLLDGPVLPLEFSRVSESRKGALTLVIDSINGSACTVSYSMSTRRTPLDAIADLRSREGTVMRRMGFWLADGSLICEPEISEAIVSWAMEKSFDAVVWTGLPSNFREQTKRDFSVDAAVEHLQNLTPEGKAMAATYLWRAPDFVRTPLRDQLQRVPWFPPA